jgi:phytoene/squalene synthetase
VTVEHIVAGETNDAWRALMAFQIGRARAMLRSGEPLGKRLRGRLGLELRMIIRGGERILGKIERVQGDVFRRRPALRWHDWPVILLNAL